MRARAAGGGGTRRANATEGETNRGRNEARARCRLRPRESANGEGGRAVAVRSSDDHRARSAVVLRRESDSSGRSPRRAPPTPSAARDDAHVREVDVAARVEARVLADVVHARDAGERAWRLLLARRFRVGRRADHAVGVAARIEVEPREDATHVRRTGASEPRRVSKTVG